MNDINHPSKGLNECNDKSPINYNPNLDPMPDFCNNDPNNSRNVNDQTLNWLKDTTNKKVGLGSAQLCDPMQKGAIINDPDTADRSTIYRYSKAKRACDDAMRDLFTDIVVIDENGKAHPIPIIWGTKEKAVAAILLDNVRKDETLVVDRIKLPMLAIHDSDIQFAVNRYVYHKALDYNRSPIDNKPTMTISEKYDRDTVLGFARGIPVDISYTLYAWTLYQEDINQILEQILLKFSQTAYIKVTGVPYEVIVKLDSIANNLDYEPGDQAIRVIKYQFNMTTETYIPQPITRKKAVLKTKIDLVDGLTENEITEVMARLEETVKELKC